MAALFYQMTPRSARRVDYVSIIKTTVALVRGFVRIMMVRNCSTTTTTIITQGFRAFVSSQCGRRKVAVHSDESWVSNVSETNDLHNPAIEWENVKMTAGLISLQPCLYFAFHHPLFDKFQLCILPSAAGAVSESTAVGQTATNTEAGLNHCSLTEQTVYSAEGGLGCWWHMDKYFVRAPLQVLGERAAGK